MKGIIRILGVTLLITAMAVPAFAWERGMGRGKGMRGIGCENCQGSNLTDEQKTKMQEHHKKFYDATSVIRDEIMKKSIDLRSALNSSEPDAKKAKAIQKDISDLEAKLAQARIDYLIEAKKICPEATCMGRGMMSGMKGCGPDPFGY